MVVHSLEDIKKNVDELSSKINAPADLLPTYGYSQDFARPHIEIDSSQLLHYVIVERGKELERKTTENPDTLLYWIFANITFSMACKYELKNRDEAKDCRQIMFEKQEELLGILSGHWRQKEKEEHENILINHPFNALAGLRAIFCGQLRHQGYSESAIVKLANEKYPQT